MDKIHEATKNYIKSDIPEFNSGDTVAVNVKVREGNCLLYTSPSPRD